MNVLVGTVHLKKKKLVKYSSTHISSQIQIIKGPVSIKTASLFKESNLYVILCNLGNTYVSNHSNEKTAEVFFSFYRKDIFTNDSSLLLL